MTKKGKTKSDDTDDIARAIATIVLVYLLYLAVLWFTKRNQFWLWLAYGLIAEVVLLLGIWAWHEVKNKIRNVKLQHLLEDVRSHGQEDNVINFINRFGMVNRRANGWIFRNYKF